MRNPLGVQAAGGHLDVDHDVRVDLEQQFLAQTEGADVVEVAGRAAQDAEAVERGAELAVTGDLEHRAVAAQDVRTVGRQGGDGGLAEDAHPATDRADARSARPRWC